MSVVKSAPTVSGFNASVALACLKRKIQRNADGEAGRLRCGLRAANHGGRKARVTCRHSSLKNHLTEIIGFFGKIVSSARSDETILLNDETIFLFRADIRKQPLVISYPSNGARRLDLNPETANADNQLYPGFCLHPGRSLDSWFFRRKSAGHRHLLLPRLAGYPLSTDRRRCELIAISTKFRRRM